MSRIDVRSYPDVTPSSIERAKQHQADERRKVTEATGVVISDDGVPILPAAVIIHCVEGCPWTASAKTVGRAMRSLAPHLVRSHGWPIQEAK